MSLSTRLSAMLTKAIVVSAVFISLHGVFASFINRLPSSGPATLGLLVLGAALFLLLIYRFRDALQQLLNWTLGLLMKCRADHFIAFALVTGVTLRVMWWYFVPVTLVWGDAPANWALANNLIEKGTYVVTTTFGTWQGAYPPGLPFALVPLILLFGKGPIAVLCAQLIFFVWAFSIILPLGRRLAGEPAARFAAILLALLPNLIMYASQPLKEPLLIAELLTFLYGVMRSNEAAAQRSVIRWGLFAGAFFGLAVLTQPAVAPILVIAVILFWLQFEPSQRISRICAVVLAAVLVIAPWSVRQTIVFGKFTPLTSSGGWGFYTGNNPASRGGYTPYELFFPDLLTIPERDRSAVTFLRGLDYVIANPKHFAELIVRRQILLTCCLDDAARNSLSPAGYGTRTVALWQGFACAAWLFLAVLIIFNRRALMRAASSSPIVVMALSMPLVTFLLHSIMEAGSRHMIMHMGVWIIAASVAGAAGAQNAGAGSFHRVNP